MEGYKWVFDNAESKFKNASADSLQLFKSFRIQREIYGFIDNGDTPIDSEADDIAKNYNKEMYDMYRDILKSRKRLGYDGSRQLYADYSNLDSRHIMMFVLLFSQIKGPFNNIVEIGGGFGNWLTLNQKLSFNKWTIIDLPHVGLLQNWFLEEQCVPKEKYDTVSALNYKEWASTQKSIDLVIGTHSLSEFSFEIFFSYFNDVISKAKHFFYCYHNTLPTPQLIQAKLQIISTRFTLISNTLSEEGNVSNCLYMAKE